MNPIRAISDLGQSLWYDNIRRGLLDSGELGQLISKGITGVTSNPTIFEKAIDGSSDYDEAIKRYSVQGLSVDELYDALVLEDIARGADLLLPIYNQTHAKDGYISIEVPPTLAENTHATIQEAHRLFEALKRPNIMIKVPATQEGIPAIQSLIADGVNVNVTLIFSLDAYRQVMEAYIKGLEDRSARGLPIDQIGSVASFFVSRVDTLVDSLIEQKHLDPSLAGRAGIANAKLAYQLYLEYFNSARFEPLRRQGAMVQRPLWASTSTKNPKYPDLLYVEALIGPDTVDTLPPATVDAIIDHGRAARTIDTEVDQARALIAQLEQHGISMKEVTDQLLAEGVKSFHNSFTTLKASLEKKSRRPRPIHTGRFSAPGTIMQQALGRLDREHAVTRLWEHDATLWSSESQHQAIIKNALGWLKVPEQVLLDVPNLQSFFQQALLDGFQEAVVLGMGGSSLVSDVLVHSFSQGKPGLKLHVLDTTHAASIESLTRALDIPHTLFLVASKSGTTTEPNAFYHYFWDVVKSRGLDPARQFVAITDPGTQMEKEAHRQGFRHVFLNPPDIGGRYSALSWFGMLPATLYGLDTKRLLEEALSMQEACQRPSVNDNPAAQLGAFVGGFARNGRDKVTFIMPEAISHLGDWLEQLLAESTGKLGTGLIPVAHEPLQPAQAYSDDRVFIVYQWKDEAPAILSELTEHGRPVVTFSVSDPYQLAQEFFRWEVACALAGSLLEIDAFDQPNVQESKDNTKALLNALDHGHLPPENTQEEGRLRWTASPELPHSSLATALQGLLSRSSSKTYIAVMAYLDETDPLTRALSTLRTALTEQTGRPTTLGYGPRFLHSTGQLHKGGPDTGLYLQLVSQSGPKLVVPHDGYDFMTLMHAQALGDFQSLVGHGRSVVRILLPDPATEEVINLTHRIQKLTD